LKRFVRQAIITAALVAVPVLAGSPALAAAQGGSQPTDRWHSNHRPHHPRPHKPRPAMPAPTTKPAPTTTPAPGTKSSALEAEVVRLTNVERAKAGCSALRIDDRLVTAARAHSTDMVKAKFFDHTGSNGSDFVQREVAAGYPKNGASAENIAYGYPTAAQVMNGWMHSTGHRENILDCESTAVGVGLALTSDGTAYWTQDFGRI
jgi:uncharacterized protein YkwD